MSVRVTLHPKREGGRAGSTAEYDPHHPSVRAAARRAGVDVETYLLLRRTERHWPASG